MRDSKLIVEGAVSLDLFPQTLDLFPGLVSLQAGGALAHVVGLRGSDGHPRPRHAPARLGRPAPRPARRPLLELHSQLELHLLLEPHLLLELHLLRHHHERRNRHWPAPRPSPRPRPAPAARVRATALSTAKCSKKKT